MTKTANEIEEKESSKTMESALKVVSGGAAAAAAEVVVVPQSFPAPASLVHGAHHNFPAPSSLVHGAHHNFPAPSSLVHGVHDQTSSVVWGQRRALIGHAVTTGFMATAIGFAVRRGRTLGFRKLFHSVSAPKDVVYIGFLYGLGDISQQLITQSRKTLAQPHEKREWDISVDWKGVASAGLVGGTVIGTFNHYWYTFLDKFIRGTSLRCVVKKVLLDQMSLPIPIAAFLVAMSVVKAKPDVFEELKAKFLTTYMYGSILWPTTQFFNFMFVPTFHRILFIGCVEFLWTNVLCFMVDLEIDKDDPLSHLD